MQNCKENILGSKINRLSKFDEGNKQIKQVQEIYLNLLNYINMDRLIIDNK